MKKSILSIITLIFFVTLANAGSYIVFFENEKNISRSDNKIINLKEQMEQTENSLFSQRNDLKVLKRIWAINALVIQGDKDKIKQLKGVKNIIEDKYERAIKVKSEEFRFSSDSEWNLKNMDVPKVWREFGVKGKGITVGIIDTGLAYDHPEFKDRNNIIRAWDHGNIISADQLGDKSGHGSHVAGIIAGTDLSGKNIGVAPECNLIIARAIGARDNEYSRASTLLEAMQFMIDPDNNPYTDDSPQVVNCSWHSSFYAQSPYYEMIEKWVDFDIIPCFSAGNRGPSAKTITNPKEHPLTFATGALDKDEKIASFSSRGPAVYNGKTTQKPDWCAPGHYVLSVDANGGYKKLSGTSMASPHVAGTIALMLQARPQLKTEDIRYILKVTAEDKGDNGYDYTYGNGSINAYKAVKTAINCIIVKGQVKNNLSQGIKATLKLDNRTINTDEKGFFTFSTIDSDISLEISAEDHFTKDFAMNLSNIENIQNKIFTLQKKNTIQISFDIKEKNSFNRLPANIYVNGESEYKGFAEDGKISFDIIPGKYSIKVTSKGFKTLYLETKEYTHNKDLDLELSENSHILLVDNSYTDEFSQAYINSIESLGHSYELIKLERDQELNKDRLTPYYIVIWFMGNNLGNYINENNREAIEQYLESGGNILISGQDVAIGLRRGAEESYFLENTLKASYRSDKPETKRVKDNNITFDLNKLSTSSFNSNSPDVIYSKNGSNSIFEYTSGGCAGVFFKDNTHRMIFLPFTLARIDSEENQEYVIKKCIDLLMPDMKEKLNRFKFLYNSSKNSPEKMKNALIFKSNLEDEIFNSKDNSAKEIIQVDSELISHFQELFFNK